MNDHRILLRGIVRTGLRGISLIGSRNFPIIISGRPAFRLFPGTLNVHLIDAVYHPPKSEVIRLEGAEYGGRVNVSILPCRIFDRLAFVLRPDTDTGKHGDPPEAILEIATDVGLRSTYGLKDGDVVEVSLPS